MEANEVFVQVEAKSCVFIGVNVHVIVIRVVLLSVVPDSSDEELINNVRIVGHLGNLGRSVLQLKFPKLLLLFLKLFQKPLFNDFLEAIVLFGDSAAHKSLEHP